jgi:hypothetical protein
MKWSKTVWTIRADSGGAVPPNARPVVRLRSQLAVVLAEERQLQAEVRLGVLAVGLRLAQVVPRHAVVIRHHLPVLLRPEELLLHEYALRPAVVARPHDVGERRPAAPVGDLPQHMRRTWMRSRWVAAVA